MEKNDKNFSDNIPEYIKTETSYYSGTNKDDFDKLAEECKKIVDSNNILLKDKILILPN